MTLSPIFLIFYYLYCNRIRTDILMRLFYRDFTRRMRHSVFSPLS